MSQGPGGGGDSQDREDRPAKAGPGNSTDGRESRSDGRENGAYGQVNGADGRGSGDRGGSDGGHSGEGGGGDGGGHSGVGRGDGQSSDGQSGDGQSGVRGDGSGGDTYDLYQRGLDLLSRGSAAAAAQLLARANTAEPGSRSVLEALARAQFDAHRYGDAADSFRQIVEASPADDYAQFGLGLALARTGNPRGAAEHLALAAAMRPDLRHYSDALRGVRATLRARREAGLPDQISPAERGSGPRPGPEPGSAQPGGRPAKPGGASPGRGRGPGTGSGPAANPGGGTDTGSGASPGGGPDTGPGASPGGGPDTGSGASPGSGRGPGTGSGPGTSTGPGAGPGLTGTGPA